MLDSTMFRQTLAIDLIRQLLDWQCIEELAGVVQKTYFQIATSGSGQKVVSSSPYLVENQEQLPDEKSRQTNRDVAQAFLNSLIDLVLHIRANSDAAWLIDYLDGFVEEGQLINPIIEFALYRTWALKRLTTNTEHPNLNQGFNALSRLAKVYDRRIAYALWQHCKEIISKNK